MKRLLFIATLMTLTLLSCGHSHEVSPEMKKVIAMNKGLWEDLNATKDKVKNELTKATTITSELDSVAKAEISTKLKTLVAKKKELSELDKLIPEIEGYQPKCNHEPGEPHTHNTMDLEGVEPSELLQIHQELRKQLDAIKQGL